MTRCTRLVSVTDGTGEWDEPCGREMPAKCEALGCPGSQSDPRTAALVADVESAVAQLEQCNLSHALQTLRAALQAFEGEGQKP